MATTDLTISIVVSTVDRAGPLRTLLSALEHQSYPRFEVIVVVGPTHDNTLEVLSAYQQRLQVLHCPVANLGQSRNLGLLAARGDIVAFIDDDAVPCQRRCEQLARLFANSYLDGTGGVVYMVSPQAPWIQHRIGLCSSLAEFIDVRSSWLESIVPEGEGRQWCARMMGTNMAFRRQALLEVGGFDEFFIYLADDPDVAMRLVNAGKIVHPVLAAPVYHVPASSRNRKPLGPQGRWWIQTNASVYFAIKHGRAAGDTVDAIATRCRKLLFGHLDWYSQLRRDGALTWKDYVCMSAEEACGALDGVWKGVFRPRRLLRSTLTTARNAQAIQLFQNDRSASQPSVNPVSGLQPVITMPDPPLRLCLLSNLYPPAHFEGVGRLTHLMAQGLFELGHTVHVLTRGEHEQIAFYDGAYVHHLPYRLERYGQYQRWPGLFHSLNYSHAVHDQVRQLMRNDGIQIVDTPLWQFDGLVTAVSGILPVGVRLLTATRQVAELQTDRDEGIRLLGEMERVLIERATCLMPNTQGTWQAIQRAYNVCLPEGSTHIVPYGIRPAPDEAVRPFDLERAPTTLTVLYVGRLEKRKGVQDLFQALPLVLKRMRNVRFILAGGDNSVNDGFRRTTGMDYPTYFAKHYPQFGPQVEFRGAVEEETLQNLYQSCDLFIAPSLYESFGLIYLEAMNYAKPVIGCQSGGVPEVVEHGVTGLLVEPEAPAALAEAVVSLLQSPARLREMGLAGRARLLEKFTYLQMAQNFEQAYREMIRSFSANPLGRARPAEQEPSKR